MLQGCQPCFIERAYKKALLGALQPMGLAAGYFQQRAQAQHFRRKHVGVQFNAGLGGYLVNGQWLAGAVGEESGDALRLAAKLKIDIEWQATNPFPEPRVEAYQRNDEGAYFCADEHEDDYRRAIVRAAAAIGEAMK